MRLANTFALTLVLAASAHAATTMVRYRWTDSHGVVQYADAPTLEALQVGYDVLDASSGMVVKHVDRPKTAEELAADANAAAAVAQKKRLDAEIAQTDRQLLSAYPTEQMLIAAQKGRLDSLDQQLKDIKISRADQEKNLDEQLTYASTFEGSGKSVPATVQQQIETLRGNIETQNRTIAAMTARRADAEQKNQVELAHYRELRAAQAKE